MADLPIAGGSEDTWGTEVNTFLTVAHEPSGVDGGKLKATALDDRTFTGTVTLPATTSIGSVSDTEISYINGVTSSIQTQISDTSSSLSVHIADTSAHITISQSTLLDNLTATYIQLNTVDTSSSITTQLGTKATVAAFNTHVADTSAHITTAQNTLLDNLTATYTQLNTVDTSSSISIQLGTKVPLITYNTHIDSSSVHGITGHVVGTTDAQILTNKTLTNPIINDTSTTVSTSAQINRLAGTLTDAKILYYDVSTNRIVSSSDTSATYTNVGTVVAGSSSNADSLHTHDNLRVLKYAQQSVQAGDIINDTSTDTTFASGYTILANTLTAGSVVRATVYYNHSTTTPAVNFTHSVKFISDSSTTTLCTTGVQSCSANETNEDVYVTFDFVVLTTGASGTIEVQGIVFHRNNGTGAAYKMRNLAPVTVNTTVNNTLKTSWLWGTKDPLYTITQRLMLVEIHKP